MKLYEMTMPDPREYLELLEIDPDRYTINDDGSVDVNGNVHFSELAKSVKVSPIKWGHIKGDFNANGFSETFTSLANCPHTVDGDFRISKLPVTSLIGGPKIVGGNYDCSNTQITSLEGVAENIGANLLARCTQITSFSGIHKTHKNLKVGQGFVFLPQVTNILGLALIPGVNRLTISSSIKDLRRFDISHHDVHQFQEELLDAGLKAQARL